MGRESVPQTVMLDGVIMDEPLAAMGLNRRWLHTELAKAGVAPENVFLAQVDSLGQLYLDLFDDSIQVPKPRARERVYASLKKCQADGDGYALAYKKPGGRENVRRISPPAGAGCAGTGAIVDKIGVDHVRQKNEEADTGTTGISRICQSQGTQAAGPVQLPQSLFSGRRDMSFGTGRAGFFYLEL